MIKVLTASRMKSFTSCQRKHFYEFIEGVGPTSKSEALLLGTCLHYALEKWWLSKTENGKPGDYDAMMVAYRDECTRQKLPKLTSNYLYLAGRIMLERYAECWKTDRYTCLGVEKQFVAPMIDPIFGWQYKDWYVSGKIDAIVRDNESGEVLLLDHKTANKAFMNDTYFDILDFECQISHYLAYLPCLGYEASNFVYDVLAKPAGIKPKLATPKDKVRKNKDGSVRKGTRLVDESQEEYFQRIQQEYDKYPAATFFKRYTVHRTEEQIQKHLVECTAIADAIDSTHSVDLAVRAQGSCTAYNRVCAYFDVCRGRSSVRDIPGMQERKPFEELDTSLLKPTKKL